MESSGQQYCHQRYRTVGGDSVFALPRANHRGPCCQWFRGNLQNQFQVHHVFIFNQKLDKTQNANRSTVPTLCVCVCVCVDNLNDNSTAPHYKTNINVHIARTLFVASLQASVFISRGIWFIFFARSKLY